MNTTTIEIPLSKAKLAKLLIFSILFLIVGLWMIITQPETSNPVFNNVFVKALAAYGGTLMGLLGIYFFTKKLFDKRPGIILDSQGITDNSGALSRGLIPWENIDVIFEKTIQASFASKERFITIGLKNPEQYIANETNPVKRKLMSLNSNNHNSPVNISTNGLKIRHGDLLQLMQERLHKYKTNKLTSTLT
jgi:hypothetical protein